MSKMDNLRAMREARFERTSAQPAKRAAPRLPVSRAAEPSDAPTAPAVETSDNGLCGHRNMGGKSCTREQGHAARSHRYS